VSLVDLATVPVHIRAEAAWWRIVAGDDPYATLHAALWPNGRVRVQTDEVVDGFCKNGHPWNAENTFIRSNGWRKCRACEREWKRTNKTKRKRVVRKEPCVGCGAPATVARDKGTGGLTTPRCRACFLEHLKTRKAAA
jgi:hypothetical protein